MIEFATRPAKIDRQARAWQKKIVECWGGRCNPNLYADTAAVTEAMFAEHGMTGPLPHDRLDLIRMATNREAPSREAFITLALVDYVEDWLALPIIDRSAKLPYQLAWARSGRLLTETTGLPAGIARARWPEGELACI